MTLTDGYGQNLDRTKVCYDEDTSVKVRVLEPWAILGMPFTWPLMNVPILTSAHRCTLTDNSRIVLTAGNADGPLPLQLSRKRIQQQALGEHQGTVLVEVVTGARPLCHGLLWFQQRIKLSTHLTQTLSVASLLSCFTQCCGGGWLVIPALQPFKMVL
jgi:hypothetical protein